MGKSNTAVKIMRVDSKTFEQLNINNDKHQKTFKIINEEQVNKIYFIHFDDQENLHFIGKHSHTGVIYRTALTREIPDGQNSSQINSHLVALIDREIAAKKEFKLTIPEKLLVTVAIISFGLVLGIGAYFGVPLLLMHAILVGFHGFILGGLGSYLTIKFVDSLFESPNSPGISEALGRLTGSCILGAGFCGVLGTAIAPGIGTLIGAGIGAALGFSICAVLFVINYVQKRADNPNLQVIQQLTESLTINEPLGGVPLKAKERGFSSVQVKDYYQARYDYGQYVGHYLKLFPTIKEIKRTEKEEAQNENLASAVFSF
ncbi:MAG: hypothetical protein H0U70_10980 [Tatlockia sp.]|nr:hypothetical protein [Tatlockia sp.]